MNATMAFLNEESNYAEDNELAAFDASFEELDVGPNREERSFSLDKSDTLVIPDTRTTPTTSR